MKPMRIEIIEDDAILSKVLRDELGAAGYEIISSYDGEDGEKVAAFEQPDLILLDLLLPKKHGFEVLTALKASPTTRNIPTIILTVLGQDEDIKRGMQLGASDYFVKSQHSIGEIVDGVKKFLEKNAAV